MNRIEEEESNRFCLFSHRIWIQFNIWIAFKVNCLETEWNNEKINSSAIRNKIKTKNKYVWAENIM